MDAQPTNPSESLIANMDYCVSCSKQVHLSKRNQERMKIGNRAIYTHIPSPWLRFEQAMHYLKRIISLLYEINGIHVFLVNMRESSSLPSKNIRTVPNCVYSTVSGSFLQIQAVWQFESFLAWFNPQELTENI